VTDVIREELQLIAKGLLQLWQRHDARVADDGIERQSQPLQRCNTGAHRVRIGQITCQWNEVPREPCDRLLRLLHGAGGGQHARAAQREHPRRLEPETGAAPGDQYRTPAEIQPFSDVLRGGCGAEPALSVRKKADE
jgi:hypothetical protein